MSKFVKLIKETLLEERIVGWRSLIDTLILFTSLKRFCFHFLSLFVSPFFHLSPIFASTFVDSMHMTHNLPIYLTLLWLIVRVVQKVPHLEQVIVSFASHKLRLMPIVEL